MLKRSACLKCFQIVKGTGKVTCSGSTMHRWLWQKHTASFTHGIKHIFALQSDRPTQDVHRPNHFVCSDGQGCILSTSSTDVNANATTVRERDRHRRNSLVQPAMRQTKASCQPNAAHSGPLVELWSFFLWLCWQQSFGKCWLWAVWRTLLKFTGAFSVLAFAWLDEWSVVLKLSTFSHHLEVLKAIFVFPHHRSSPL